MHQRLFFQKSIMFGFLLEDILRESVNNEDIIDAIANHKRIIINYESKTVDVANGPRLAEIYAFGATKAGNDAIRVFQPYGDTASRVPSWKLMRLDGIVGWKDTGQTFSRPASDYYKGYGDFNPNGDKSMAVVYQIAHFDTEPVTKDLQSQTNPKKTSDVYKTDTEKNMERLRQQTDNPITLSDFKAQKGFEGLKQPQLTTGPKKIDKGKEKQPTNTELYKTDTERGMDNLRKQLENPRKIDLDQFRNRIGDTSKPLSPNEVRKRLSEPEEQPTNTELYKTDTERGMDNLRKQLENPRKIDLSTIPRR